MSTTPVNATNSADIHHTGMVRAQASLSFAGGWFGTLGSCGRNDPEACSRDSGFCS
jgi:hypothetical protein